MGLSGARCSTSGVTTKKEDEVFVAVATVVIDVEETLMLQSQAQTAAVVDDALVLSSIGKMLREVRLEPRRLVPSCIYRVRKKIRSEDPEAYHPQLVSIGPFHRGNQSLLPMERVKLQFLSDLIDRHPGNTLHNYIKAVSTTSSVEEVSKCYSEQVAPDSNSLIEMMVLDGCFIVEYFIKYFLGEYTAELGFHSNQSLLIKDLLLLENQVPFSILQSLFDSSILPSLQVNNRPITFAELALIGIIKVPEQPSIPIPEGAHHLLHLYHASLRPPPCSTSQEIASKSWTFRSMKRRIVNFSYMLLYRLLVCRSWTKFKPVRAPMVVESATMLYKAGVRFKHTHRASCFTDVTFSIKEGTMVIPRMSINELSVSKLRNLLEFEKCLTQTENHIASYVVLMSNLIDTPEDVLLLKRNRVLENKLCEDEEVVRFFNILSKEVHLDYQNHHLAGLFKDVYEYYFTDSHRWRFLIMSSYFTKPWSFVSLMTVCILLALTFLQTFFAVYAYFRPS